MLCVLCNTTQAADNNKVLSEDWFKKFSKTANFLSFYKRNQTTIVNSFYPKSPQKVRFGDRVVTFCSEWKQTMNFCSNQVQNMPSLT